MEVIISGLGRPLLSLGIPYIFPIGLVGFGLLVRSFGLQQTMKIALDEDIRTP